MATRIEREKKTLRHMIHIYCKGHGHNPVLCNDCSELLAYSITTYIRISVQ